VLKKILLIVCSMMIAGSVQAWEMRAQATDSTGVTVDSGSISSLPGTPVSSSIQVADKTPGAYAEVDLPGGSLRALAQDPIGGGTGTLAIGSANLNRHYFKNTTGNTYNVPGGIFGMVIAGTHSASGTPSAQGEQKAGVQYSMILEWRSLTNATIWAQNVLTSKMENIWMDGNDNGTTLTEEVAVQGDSYVLELTDTTYLAVLEVPAFTWEPDEVMYLRASLNVFATTSDAGLGGRVDAMNTASLYMSVPPGIDVEDAGLMTLDDLGWVTLLDTVFADGFEGDN
jgi:hypothetical protein